MNLPAQAPTISHLERVKAEARTKQLARVQALMVAPDVPELHGAGVGLASWNLVPPRRPDDLESSPPDHPFHEARNRFVCARRTNLGSLSARELTPLDLFVEVVPQWFSVLNPERSGGDPPSARFDLQREGLRRSRSYAVAGREFDAVGANLGWSGHTRDHTGVIARRRESEPVGQSRPLI